MTTLQARLVVVFILCAALCAVAVAQPPGGAKDPVTPVNPKDVTPKKDVAPPVNPKDVVTPKKDVTPVVPPKDVTPPKVVPPVVPPKDTTQIKAFELKTANPADVQQILNKQFAAPVTAKVGTPPPPAPTVRVAFDARTKTVFVRGTATELETAGKLIAQLDGGQILTLQNATVEDVMKVLTALELGAKVQAYPLSKVIVVAQNDPQTEQIKVVVARLDGVQTAPILPKKN